MWKQFNSQNHKILRYDYLEYYSEFQKKRVSSLAANVQNEKQTQ